MRATHKGELCVMVTHDTVDIAVVSVIAQNKYCKLLPVNTCGYATDLRQSAVAQNYCLQRMRKQSELMSVLLRTAGVRANVSAWVVLPTQTFLYSFCTIRHQA